MRFLLLLLITLCCSNTTYAQAVWGNKTYNNRVCSNPNCRMCNSIEAQLWQQQTTAQNATNQSQHQFTYTPTTTSQPQNPTTTTQNPNPLPSSAYTPQSTQHSPGEWVPVTQLVKRCNGRVCWYENVTTLVFRPGTTQPTVTNNTTDSPASEPTPYEAIPYLIKLANPAQQEVLYDLGCGDGRILVAATQSTGCRTVGIDLDPKAVKATQSLIDYFNLNSLIRVYENNILNLTYPEADVATIYLYPDLLLKAIEKLPKGCRIVSYMHEFPNSTQHQYGEHIFYTGVK